MIKADWMYFTSKPDTPTVYFKGDINPVSRRKLLNVFDKKIICDICNKPIRKLEIFENYNKDSISVTVFCHNDYETVELGNIDIEDAVDIKIDRAFVTKRLTNDSTINKKLKDGTNKYINYE